MDARDNIWPSLRLEDWTETREALQLWLQVVGKIELVSTKLVNHWWNVTYEVSARGLRTRLMHSDGHPFDAEFDFVDQVLTFRSSDGRAETVALHAQSVAAFASRALAACAALGVDCTISERPNEVSPAVPFADDTAHRNYDGAAARTFWQQLVQVERVFSLWRAGFSGKASPVHLFWGSMDLSSTRFSGRVAPPHQTPPPNCPPWVMQEAESRENAAAGFWPGASDEGAFYAYVYPEPPGYGSAGLTVGRFDESLGEWLLPYEEVRMAADPETTLLTFLNETYARGADLAGWDRALLEVDPHRLDQHLPHPRPPR